MARDALLRALKVPQVPGRPCIRWFCCRSSGLPSGASPHCYFGGDSLLGALSVVARRVRKLIRGFRQPCEGARVVSALLLSSSGGPRACSLRVTEAYQRRGLGEAITRALMARARELGFKRLILDTTTEQAPAQGSTTNSASARRAAGPPATSKSSSTNGSS